MMRLVILAFLIGITSMEVASQEAHHPHLTSCVGRQYVMAQPAAPANTVESARTCHTLGDISVCRVGLNDTQEDNATIKVMVLLNGGLVQEWRESADPAYFDQMHVLVRRQAKGVAPTVIVTTQQAESQGMGVQEWAINVLNLSGPVTRRTFVTAELGPTGFLVADPRQASPVCKLLLTQWESRETAHGERLFLKIYLADPHRTDPNTALLRRLRFDKRLERLRQSAPSDRPLRYMQIDQDGRGGTR